MSSPQMIYPQIFVPTQFCFHYGVQSDNWSHSFWLKTWNYFISGDNIYIERFGFFICLPPLEFKKKKGLRRRVRTRMEDSWSLVSDLINLCVDCGWVNNGRLQPPTPSPIWLYDFMWTGGRQVMSQKGEALFGCRAINSWVSNSVKLDCHDSTRIIQDSNF